MKGIGLVGLQIKNLGAIKEVAISLEPGINVFQGDNSVGKSTILNAITYAFDGKRSIPDGIIRKGEDRAMIEVNTTDFDVELELYNGKNGQTPKLCVKNKGFVKNAPQVFLDSILSKYSDPREIASFGTDDMFKLMLEYAKIDTKKIDEDIETLKESQMFIRRSIKEAGTIQPVEVCEGIDVADTIEKINEIAEKNKVIVENTKAFEELKEREDQEKEAHHKIVVEIQRIDDEIARLQSACAVQKEDLKKAEVKIADAIKKADDYPDIDPVIDPAPYHDQLTKAQEINRKYDVYTRYLEWKNKRDALQVGYDKNEIEITQKQEEKKTVFLEADMPIDGVNVNDEQGVFYRDIPWRTLAESERLMLAAKMIVATTPENAVRYMVIHQGESILSKIRKELHKYLVDSDFTCLMQVASDEAPPDSPGFFYVVEGEIVQGARRIDSDDCPVS